MSFRTHKENTFNEEKILRFADIQLFVLMKFSWNFLFQKISLETRKYNSFNTFTVLHCYFIKAFYNSLANK